MSVSKNSAVFFDAPKNKVKYMPLAQHQPPSAEEFASSPESLPSLNDGQTRINFKTSNLTGTREMRKKLASRILFILAFQLDIVLVGTTTIYYFFKDHLQMASTFTALLVSIFILLFSALAMGIFIYYPKTRTMVPINYIILGIFTFNQTVFFGFLSSQFTGHTICLSLTIAFLVILCFFCLSLTDLFDFSNHNLMTLVLLVVHVAVAATVFSLAYLFNFATPSKYLFFGVMLPFIFTFFILQELQQIFMGKPIY